MTTNKIAIYDTTLRDGAQAEGVSLSVVDKVRIAQKLDALGVHFIEGGWPGSNPKDTEFFEVMKSVPLKTARLVAFTATRKWDRAATPQSWQSAYDSILAAGVKHVCLFGKTWDLHVRKTLKVSLDDNLELIGDSIAFFKSHQKTVFFDAEHFFDGYKANPSFALRCLKVAKDHGAQVLILCDTNGGTLPDEIERITKVVTQKLKSAVGIHCHNDGELAVANTLAAIRAGATQVQGTINGIGERCGNANLVSVMANIELKIKGTSVGKTHLKKLTDTSRFVDQVLNRHSQTQQAFVGESAFAHKGGIHVSAVLKHQETWVNHPYEHIDPRSVGNAQRILLSDQAGLATIRHKLKTLDVPLSSFICDEAKLLKLMKEREKIGYQYEDAEASFALLAYKSSQNTEPHFQLIDFRIVDIIQGDETKPPHVEASVHLRVGTSEENSKATGVGPVHALDTALRKSLTRFYPTLTQVVLMDYKVRVLSSDHGTESRVRVHIEFSNGKRVWNTVGVSENIIQASYLAIVDGIDFYLLTHNSIDAAV